MIRLGLRENKTAFRPGENIAGAVLWEFEKAPESAEVRLLWFTRGKGTEDGGTVATATLDAPPAADTRTFSFQAPNGPYSFSGTLVAVLWAVEFVAKPGGEFQRVEIVIAPDAREIHLPRIEQPKPAGPRIRGH
ncbi:MAG: hypothetical protein ABI318_18725 [Chthoniobacteraceae bacterium]